MIKFLGIKKGDWKAIAFCVFAAITFWFFNTMTMDYSIDVTHPLVVVYDEEQYIPMSKLPTQVRFSTTASGWDIFTKTNAINASPIEVNLEDFKKRKYITASRLKAIVAKQMNGIQINEILDDTIYVNFDKLKSKKIHLQVDPKKLSLAEGYRLAGSVILEPADVTATGPASMIKEVQDVVNMKVEAKDISGNFDEELPIITTLNKKIKFNVEKVRVRLEAYQLEKVEKELKLIKVNFPKKKKVKISEDKTTLIYYAREEDLLLIAAQSFEAQVDFNSLNEKDKTIKITLKKVPELIQSYQFDPKTVQVSYEE
ncbi:MAG TPA: hypothetical protein VNB90_10265 [Cytophagaceae bacterium]|nr:hypothetical protein [Cytophagaceae bacterium]